MCPPDPPAPPAAAGGRDVPPEGRSARRTPSHSFVTIRPEELTAGARFGLLTSVVAPRPIALVSTVDEAGSPNLAPFSFFNTFGASPPMVGFSPSRRVRDATTKDTLRNLEATGECVVQVVPYALVHQVNLASAELPPGVDEFGKSGLTPLPSLLVRPPRVAESPVQLECRVRQIVPLGDGPGSGNLCLCEILCFHVAESVRTGKQRVDPAALDLVGRLGGDYYVRASREALFPVEKPDGDRIIGWDALPDRLRLSDHLSANDVARLATCPAIPSPEAVEAFAAAHPPRPGTRAEIIARLRAGDRDTALAHARHLLETGSPAEGDTALMAVVRHALAAGDLDYAWLTALMVRRRT